MPDKYFWDTNLWVYLNTKSQDVSDEQKRKKLVALLLSIPKIVVSVQVLNELANVLMKKYNHPESDTKTRLEQIRNQTEVVFLSDQLTLDALDLKARYQLAWYDSLIVAAALEADCKFLFSEDLQGGMTIEGKLKVVNPFNL